MSADLPIEEIYRRYAEKLKRYLLSLCGNNALADDLTSDTFLKAVKNIESFGGGNMFTWLCTIGKNTYFDYLRKKESANMPLNSEDVFCAVGLLPENLLIEKSERLKLYGYIQKLQPEAREVVYLKMFTDFKFKDIGCIMGKSENWARVTFFRSKIKLKEMIENEV